ncbi:MAG: hypothetical protein P0S96_08510 [Simkaniaceae bacterium]|nr:hypothetical protein [Candidatus Sacchlamyda saccharinae]
MTVQPRDTSLPLAQQLIAHNNQLTIFLKRYRDEEVSVADLKVAAANIAGALPFYRGSKRDEPSFKDSLQSVEANYSLLQKEIIFAKLRKGTLYLGAMAALYLSVLIWQKSM